MLIKRADTISCTPQGNVIDLSVINPFTNANFSNTVFHWTVPAGWLFNGPVNNSSVSLVAGNISGLITVSAEGCSVTPLFIALKIKPAKPTAIAGLACIASGNSLQTYSVNSLSGHTFFWNNTSGWSNSGPINNSITYNAVTGINMPNVVSVKDSTSGGCYSDTSQLVINNAASADSINIAGCWNVGILDSNYNQVSPLNSSLLFKVNSPQPGVTFHWSITPTTGGSFNSTTGDNVTFTANGKPGVYTISVTPYNSSCGAGSSKTRTVIIAANGKINFILSNSNTPPFITGDYLYITNYKSGSNFSWFSNYSGNVLPSSTSYSNAYLFQNEATAGTFYFAEVSSPSASLSPAMNDSFVCKTVFKASPTYYGARLTSLDKINFSKGKVTVSPNPTKNEFILSIPDNLLNSAITIYDSKGNLIIHSILLTNSMRFPTHTWKAGIYFLKLFNNKTELFTKKVVVVN